MNLLEIKNMVMFQSNNDADDLGDFLPYLTDYINEGYDRLVGAYCGQRVTSDSDEFPRLRNDKSSPAIPDWSHRAIADWATWLIYRNGNLQKQSRGLKYRDAFLEVESKIRGMGSGEKGLTDEQSSAMRYGKYITNIPR